MSTDSSESRMSAHYTLGSGQKIFLSLSATIARLFLYYDTSDP